MELTQEEPPDFNDRILTVKTADSIKTDAKAPWKGLEFEGRVESRFLFRTALAKSILPFAMYKPEMVVLPITIEQDEEKGKQILLHNADELMSDGYLNASKWFKNAENIWDIHRTEKNQKVTLENYLNWQNKLLTQEINAEYLVIYNMSGKDAYSTVINRSGLPLEFLVDYTTYRIELTNQLEAYYLASILNSSIPNSLMKDFQARGLFGARHVSKKILDIYFPKFDENDSTHIQLAELGKLCHAKAEQYIKDNPPQKELIAVHLGRLRLAIKKHLVKEMKEIDKIVKKLVG